MGRVVDLLKYQFDNDMLADFGRVVGLICFGDEAGGIPGFGNEFELLRCGEGKTSEIVSHEAGSLFLRFRSKKAGLIGASSNSTLHVNIATTSDIGGLRFA